MVYKYKSVLTVTCGILLQEALAQPASTPQLSASIPQSATEQRPPLTMETRGDILMARKKYREAVDTYRQATGDPAVISNKIGIAFHQLLDLDSAKKQYEKAVRENGTYAEAINNLGTIYYSRKNYRRAIRFYKKALTLTPNSAAIYSNLGTAYFARRDYKTAFDTYQKALTLDPEVFEHRSANGVLLQERTVEERAKFHYYLAKTYAKAGMVERALLCIRKAIEEGFKERQKLKADPEFAQLQDLPEFQELLTLQPKVL